MEGRRQEARSANVEDEVEREIVADLAEELHARLDGVQCPQHGTGVRSVDVAGNSFEELGFEINGCCLKLKEAAT